MKKAEPKSTRDLINTIESKDRRFRTAWVIFMFIISLVLCGVVIFQLKTNQKIDAQLSALKDLSEKQQVTLDAVKASGDQRTTQLQQVNDHIDCIASFFNYKDRTTARITDLDQCRIERLDGSTTTLPTNKSNSQPSPQPTAQNGGQTPSNSQQPTNSGSGQAPENPPVEILGVPVCVPFTGVCVR